MDQHQIRLQELASRFKAGESDAVIMRAMRLSATEYGKLLGEAEEKGLVARRTFNPLAAKAWDDLSSLTDDELRRLHEALHSEAASRFFGRSAV